MGSCLSAQSYSLKKKKNPLQVLRRVVVIEIKDCPQIHSSEPHSCVLQDEPRSNHAVCQLCTETIYIFFIFAVYRWWNDPNISSALAFRRRTSSSKLQTQTISLWHNLIISSLPLQRCFWLTKKKEKKSRFLFIPFFLSAKHQFRLSALGSVPDGVLCLHHLPETGEQGPFVGCVLCLCQVLLEDALKYRK